MYKQCFAYHRNTFKSSRAAPEGCLVVYCCHYFYYSAVQVEMSCIPVWNASTHQYTVDITWLYQDFKFTGYHHFALIVAKTIQESIFFLTAHTHVHCNADTKHYTHYTVNWLTWGYSVFVPSKKKLIPGWFLRRSMRNDDIQWTWNPDKVQVISTVYWCVEAFHTGIHDISTCTAE